MAPPSPSPPPSLDYWRAFFCGARGSIFDAIDAAIRVAAADSPDALRARRDAIAERLYTALLLPGCGAGSLCSSDRAEVVTDDGGGGGGGGGAPRNNSEADDAVVAEAFRVKAALTNAQDKSEAELGELLGRLRQLEFTVDAIRATEIAMAVKPLRKHGSKHIRQLVRSLIDGWKATVNEWVNNEGPVIIHLNQWMLPAWIKKKAVLPSPPMDEAALFATPCTSIQLSEFFDEMDDDGNIRSEAKEGGQCDPGPANQEPVKKQSPAMGQWYDPEQNWRLDQSAMKQSQPNGSFSWETRQQPNSGAQVKPSSAAFGPGRPKQQEDASVTQRRPKPTMPKPSTRHDENSIRGKLELAKDAKLEATKRKLQEGYQEFNNAKKQRTIQMVDPQDLPKKQQGRRNLVLNGKPRNSSSLRNRLGMAMRR